MCGLAGFLQKPKLDSVTSSHLVDRMTAAIAHRGPDSDGIWLDTEAGIALGHRRLSILDLSPAGNQPMISPSGRYVLSFNGEIYNHRELRASLEAQRKAPNWRGQCDTETLAAAFDAWGIAATVRKAVGMFAIAIWDRERKVLTLVRDRLGEKPLFYGWQGNGRDRVFLFGSELKALRKHPSCGSEVDRGAITQLLRYGHIGGDNAVFVGIQKLTAGSLVEVSLESPEPKTVRYWSGADVARQSATVRAPSGPDAIADLENLLTDAVSSQMMSDVPLGAFLSGGIDSSLVVALMQRHSARPVKTFTIGFHDARYNEAEYAKSVAAQIGTDHVELYVGESELRDIVPSLPEIYDEPFADCSQIPTALVAKLARSEVTVALSGDGGDELFGGYDRYRHGAKMMRFNRAVPQTARSLASSATRAVPQKVWDVLLDPLRSVPSGKEPNGQRMHRLADYARSRSVEELHRKLVSRWRFPESVVIGGVEPRGPLDDAAIEFGSLNDAERMMMLDMLTYLPDDILTKVDRASMWSSLECRAPFLDHRVVERAWSLPIDMKYRNGQSKWILRQILHKYVPRELTERPKMGFEVPLASWLRGPLKSWAGDLLATDRIKREGFFDAALLNRKWDEHLSGACNWGPQLWNVLMFQSWLEHARSRQDDRVAMKATA
jgi:asparagine synthase (glutamine-hydrolysing)